MAEYAYFIVSDKDVLTPVNFLARLDVMRKICYKLKDGYTIYNISTTPDAIHYILEKKYV